MSANFNIDDFIQENLEQSTEQDQTQQSNTNTKTNNTDSNNDLLDDPDKIKLIVERFAPIHNAQKQQIQDLTNKYNALQEEYNKLNQSSTATQQLPKKAELKRFIEYLDTDITDGLDYAYKAKYGFSPSEAITYLAGQLNNVSKQISAMVVKEQIREFTSSNEDYDPNSQEHAQKVTEILTSSNLPPTTLNLNMAWNEAKRQGVTPKETTRKRDNINNNINNNNEDNEDINISKQLRLGQHRASSGIPSPGNSLRSVNTMTDEAFYNLPELDQRRILEAAAAKMKQNQT